jgi:hypothetical protein
LSATGSLACRCQLRTRARSWIGCLAKASGN